MSARSDLASLSRKRLERLESSLKAALEAGEVEAIHQVRVSSRKLVEFIFTFGTCTGERPVRRARKALRRLRNLFREVRDLDVLQLSLSRGGDAKLSPTDLAQLEGSLTTRRERMLNRVRSECKSRHVDRVVDQVEALIDEFESTAQEDDAQILEAARGRWRKRADDLIAETNPATQRKSLHPMRIKLKRFRYSTELLLRLEGREGQDVLQQLAGLQDELGVWNDGVYAVREVTRIARQPDTIAAEPRRSASLLAYAGERCLDMEARHESILSRLPATHAYLERVRQTSLMFDPAGPAPLANTAG